MTNVPDQLPLEGVDAPEPAKTKKVVPLTAAEQKELEACELRIGQGVVDVGRAFIEIRDKKLYREEFSTFAKYCDSRWNKSTTWVTHLTNAAKAYDLLITKVSTDTMNQIDSLAHLRVLHAIIRDEGLDAAVALVEQGVADNDLRVKALAARLHERKEAEQAKARAAKAEAERQAAEAAKNAPPPTLVVHQGGANVEDEPEEEPEDEGLSAEMQNYLLGIGGTLANVDEILQDLVAPAYEKSSAPLPEEVVTSLRGYLEQAENIAQLLKETLEVIDRPTETVVTA